MDRRRFIGLAAMAGGVLAALLGKLAADWEFLALATVLAVLGLIGGGLIVAQTYRAEATEVLGGSRWSMIAASAKARAIPKGREASGLSDLTSLESYAEAFGQELTSCEELVAEPAVSAAALDAARERLALLVANPLYGRALQRGLIDESAVLSVMAKFGDRP